MTTRNHKLSLRMAVLALALFLTASVMAQKLQPFVYIGYGVSDYGSDDRSDVSWKLGGGVECPFHKHWGVRPMLELTRKGADELILSNYREHAWLTRLFYAEIPVVAYYTGKLSEKWTIQAGAGPYASYGLWGKIEMWGDESYNVFGSEMNFKRFDYGCQMMVQVRKKHWAFSLVYEKGFVKLTDKFYRTSPYNNDGVLCVMYYF